MTIRKFGLLMVLTALNPLSSIAQGIADIARQLVEAPAVTADVKFSVSLPHNDTDVTYDIAFTSLPNGGTDPLSPCDYLIEWSLPTPTGTSNGFSAYYDGHHYRYRDQRLQEYHTQWDSIPFIINGPGRGVQSSAQFVELLPQYLGLEILATLSDSSYTYSAPKSVIFDGNQVNMIKMRRTIAGQTAAERTYYFQLATGLPLRIDTESNPGSITEQSILVDYHYSPMGQTALDSISEQALMERFPEIFEKYRISNFRIENLPGTTLPSFSLPATDGSRLTHQRGQGFSTPVIIVFIDPATALNEVLIEQVRNATAILPYQAITVWAFTSNSRDVIETLIGEKTPQGEIAVTGATALARDCGVASYPVIVMAGSDGVVKKVVLGVNKDLADVVLQNMALIK